MSRWTNRPIDFWPGKMTRSRIPSPFRSAWGKTMQALDLELRELSAVNVVLQRAFRESDLRLDGEPRAHARAEHPGVILSFDSRRFGPTGSLETVPMQFACDRFTSWEDNVRAIALGLEALRRIKRYGIGQGDEQYTGWQKLPAGGTTIEAAQAVIDAYGGERAALLATHPDHGGDPAAFHRVMEARKILGAG